jgi:hypothetical protein
MQYTARPESGVEDFRREPDRFVPRPRSGDVVEYERAAFTEIEGVGRAMDPEAKRIAVHGPESEIAGEAQRIRDERNASPAGRATIARYNAGLCEMASSIQLSRAAEFKRLGCPEDARRAGPGGICNRITATEAAHCPGTAWGAGRTSARAKRPFRRADESGTRRRQRETSRSTVRVLVRTPEAAGQ